MVTPAPLNIVYLPAICNCVGSVIEAVVEALRNMSRLASGEKHNVKFERYIISWVCGCIYV